MCVRVRLRAACALVLLTRSRKFWAPGAREGGDGEKDSAARSGARTRPPNSFDSAIFSLVCAYLFTLGG